MFKIVLVYGEKFYVRRVSLSCFSREDFNNTFTFTWGDFKLKQRERSNAMLRERRSVGRFVLQESL